MQFGMRAYEVFPVADLNIQSFDNMERSPRAGLN